MRKQLADSLAERDLAHSERIQLLEHVFLVIFLNTGIGSCCMKWYQQTLSICPQPFPKLFRLIDTFLESANLVARDLLSEINTLSRPSQGRALSEQDAFLSGK